MNCPEAQRHLLADREAPLGAAQRAAVDAHVEHCGDCQRVRNDLGDALALWRRQAAGAAVPDADREWLALRRRIRGGVEAGSEAQASSRRRRFTWVALPLGAAAALVVTFLLDPAGRRSSEAVERVPAIARHETAPPAVADPSTLVFVDDKSGWLVVWSSPSGNGHL